MFLWVSPWNVILWQNYFSFVYFIFVYLLLNIQEEVDAAVAELLRLKGEYKNLTGEDVAGGGRGKKEKKKESGKDNVKKDSKPVNKQEKTVTENGDADSGAKKITRFAKSANFHPKGFNLNKNVVIFFFKFERKCDWNFVCQITDWV